MFAAMGISAILVTACILVHYEALRLMSVYVPSLPIAVRLKVLIVVLGCFVAHTIGEKREEDDGEPEAGESAAGDGAEIGLGEPELPAKVGQHTATYAETDAGRDERHEAREED